MNADVPRGLLTLGGLREALGSQQPLFVFVITCNVLAQAGSALAGVAAAWAVSAAVLGRPVEDLALPTALAGVGVVARGVFSWLESWLGHDLSFQMMSTIRGWVYDAIARLAPFGLGRRRVGDVATTTLTDSEALEIFYAHSSIYIASAMVSTPILWLGLVTISPTAALAIVPVLLIAVAVPLLLRGSARRTGQRLRRLVAEIGSEVREDVGAVREIVGFGLIGERIRRVHDLDAELARLQQANIRRAALESAVGGVASVACSLLTAAVLASEAVDSPERLLWLAPSVTLAALVPAPILQWIGVTKHYGTTGEAAQRIERLLHAPSPVDRSGTHEPTTPSPDLTTERVSFTWPGADPENPTLDDVSVDRPAGASVAIAGRSGAGKSTLAAVLSHFIEPDSGVVRLGGAPVPEIDPEAFARTVCTVPQDAYLFAGTVRDNLELAVDHRPSDDELWRALASAHAADLVRALPGALDAPIGEAGIGISGGEHQRLALARALLRDPQVLVLDEAVSQLDVQTEHDVSTAIAALGRGRTTIVIAHRLSTLLGAAEILVVDDGHLVARGRHGDLLETCPVYRDLIAHQLRALQP